RTTWLVPVVLGERIPRPDRSAEERDRWAMIVLILFVPWRHPRDLRRSGETWSAAYDRRQSEIPVMHKEIVRNLTILSECRQARDD
ncbi:hypothetical protein C8Q76DRAFT_578340, partial [Earliella scabrosa]